MGFVPTSPLETGMVMATWTFFNLISAVLCNTLSNPKASLCFERDRIYPIAVAHSVKLQIKHTHRPIMADWNGDGNMDMLLLAKVFGRRSYLDGSDIAQSQCTSYLYEQHKIGGKTTLVFKDEPFFRNEGCSSFDGSGASFIDVDGDGDLDAIFGSHDGPLHVYNRTSAGLVKSNEFPSNSTPLDMIHLKNLYDYHGLTVKANCLHPVLADWDLDGDLDLALLHPLGYKHPEENRYFLHLPDNTVTELNGPPNSSCPIDWGKHFSVADFDGDGKDDLVGFGELVGYGFVGVVVCLQTSSGFVVVEPEKIPFNYLPHCSQCLTNLSYYWNDGILGFPFFLDWDGDGDMDVLRKDLADKAFTFCFHSKQKSKHKAIHFLKTYAAILYRCFFGMCQLDLRTLDVQSPTLVLLIPFSPSNVAVLTVVVKAWCSFEVRVRLFW